MTLDDDGGDALLAPLLDALRGGSLTAWPGDAASALTFDPYAAAGFHATRKVFPAAPARLAGGLPTTADLPWLSAVEVAQLVRTGALGVDVIARAQVARIGSVDGELNSFITVTADHPSWRPVKPTGRLAGVPVGVKDLIDCAGVVTTCGSAAVVHRSADRDADCWSAMMSEGAVLMGKLNTQEFAAGVTGDNDHFGPVRNPWAPQRLAGGSSSGPAAAVAAGLVTVSLGTDTGGSIRIPASCCAVVGLKPTYGLVSTRGVFPLSWSLDHVGPLARTVADAALVLDVLAGTNCSEAARSGAAHGLSGIRIAVPYAWLADIDPEVAAVFTRACATLEAAGADLLAAPTLPDLGRLYAVNRVIAFAEGSAHHEKFLRSGSPPYGPSIRQRMVAGRELLAGDYLTAQRVRLAACREFGNLWSAADVVVTPTLPCQVPQRGMKTVPAAGRSEPVAAAMVRFTGPFNLTGMPAISVPAGVDVDGLPVGLQIAGPVGEDASLCFVAAAYEAGRAGVA